MSQTKIEWTDNDLIPCACGCGEMIPPVGSRGRMRRYLPGHNLLTPEIRKRPRKGQPAEKNPNWKGGRTVASNGYILVKAPEHPLADVRGYVYEHRLVAEQILGRPLRQGEVIHHLDGNKQNNSPDNLRIEHSIAHHRLRHRKKVSNRRLPGEPNPIIECACGCGGKFYKYDDNGRPRRYISGHNMRGDNRQWQTRLQ